MGIYGGIIPVASAKKIAIFHKNYKENVFGPDGGNPDIDNLPPPLYIEDGRGKSRLDPGKRMVLMAGENKKKTVLQSLRGLRGNARVAVFHEPGWSIPYGLYSFYLSLYMKSQGVTDVQIGFLISLNFIVGTIAALFAGAAADKIGRRKTVLIFGMFGWVGSVLLNLFACNFWMFALAQGVCAVSKISDVAWQLTFIEDSDDEQRLAAFNLFGIIDILAGFLTPIAGVLVANLGLVRAERSMLVFAAVCMSAIYIHRHIQYHETQMGRLAMERSRSISYWETLKNSLSQMKNALGSGNRRLRTVLAIVVLFNAYQPIGAYSSMYFAPYLTDVAELDAAVISVLGIVNSAFMLSVYLFAVPAMSRFNKLFSLTVGLGIQMVSMLSRMLLPKGSIAWAVVSVALFSVGFGLCRPFLDALLAEASPEEERSGVYALKNTLISLASALAGSLSGFLYRLNPKSIYLASLCLLALCILFIFHYFHQRQREERAALSGKRG